MVQQLCMAACWLAAHLMTFITACEHPARHQLCQIWGHCFVITHCFCWLCSEWSGCFFSFTHKRLKKHKCHIYGIQCLLLTSAITLAETMPHFAHTSFDSVDQLHRSCCQCFTCCIVLAPLAGALWVPQASTHFSASTLDDLRHVRFLPLP